MHHHVEARWPYLMVAAALLALSLGLTAITVRTGDLGAAMCAAITCMGACTIIGLVIAECLFRGQLRKHRGAVLCASEQLIRDLLAEHREAMAEVVAGERVQLEDIARAAARAAATEVTGGGVVGLPPRRT